MHCTSPLSHRTDDGAVETLDGVRFLVGDDPARTVIVRRPDRGVVRLTLGEFMQERRLAAQSLRQAELDRCVNACMRRLRTLRSTAKWRVRQAVRRMATLRGPASPQPR